ncbi:MAG TPA: rhodanese-like domain-containing protein [Saprospiraceae bacterium]|nr:rhodanese-like domain-containing protein [Saprospiraceae bacterium]
MKELKRTQRLLIAGIVFFALIVVGLLSFKKPFLEYKMNAKEALSLVGNTEKMVSVKDLNIGGFQLIDVRNQFEYAKGHIDDATNIYAPDLFKPFSIKYLKQLKKEGKKIVLYGKDIQEASDPWIILSQLDFNNLYYLKEGYDGYQLFQANKSLANWRQPEEPALDFAKFFVDAQKAMEASYAKARAKRDKELGIARVKHAEAIQSAAQENAAERAAPAAVKAKVKVVKIRKKKKKRIGGC